MAKTNNLTDFLKDLADGIRAKKGTSGDIDPQNFRSEIESIQTGSVEDLTALLNEQEELIATLQETLRTKANGALEDSSIFDPTTETIVRRSTASYKDIFTTKTAMGFTNTGSYAGYLGCKFDAEVGETYKITWEKTSASAYLFYVESDTILTKADNNYGTRLQDSQSPFMLTATKPYVYLWIGLPSSPSNNLVLVTGLMVHKV